MPIKINDVIEFDSDIKYTIKHSGLNGYFLSNMKNDRFMNSYNNEIFDKLKIIDKYKFCTLHYGHEVVRGIFPYAKNLESLEVLINELKKLC